MVGFTHRHTTKQLNDKYRFFRKDIERVMLWENEDIEIMDIIKARINAIIPGTEKIIAMNKTGELQAPLDSLLTSLIHMTMNRWFRTKTRLHELVIYDFLARYYTSKIARELKVQSSIMQ